MKPVNNIKLTAKILCNLHQFMESEMIDELGYFSEYEKQAVLDATVYLQGHQELLELLDRARKLAFKTSDDEDEDRLLFAMESNENE